MPRRRHDSLGKRRLGETFLDQLDSLTGKVSKKLFKVILCLAEIGKVALLAPVCNRKKAVLDTCLIMIKSFV